LINFLFLFATIYLKAELSEQNPGIARFVDRILDSVSGEGRTYRDFMFAQGTVTMLLLGLAGEMLVGNDFRHGGLIYYLSRRLGRHHYLTGKLLASLTLVWLITTVPALVLFVQYGLLTKSFDYFWGNGQIVLGILGYGFCMGIPLSLVLFALAAWLQRTVPLLMAWAGIFLFLPVVGALLREIQDDRRWQLLNLWRNIRLLGSWCFGAVTREQDQQLLGPALGIVMGVCFVALIVSIVRIRAVRVVV
jgi:ABC-2 type transport system permease protein